MRIFGNIILTKLETKWLPFAVNIFKCILLEENIRNWIQIWSTVVPKNSVDDGLVSNYKGPVPFCVGGW